METEGFINRVGGSRLWHHRGPREIKCQYEFFVPQSQKQIAVSRSKGTAHRWHGPGGGLSALSVQSPRPGFTPAPSSGCCALVGGKQKPQNSCPSPCQRLEIESRQS